MSIINIVYHDENIYSVAQKEKVAAAKPPRYHSKFEQMVRCERKQVLDDHRTFGYSEVPLHCPQHFLKKDCGVRCHYPPSPRQCLSPQKKPPVPKRKDLCLCAPQCQTTSCKNFRLENIKRVVTAAPKRPKAKFCDTRHGDFHDLEPSGLVPIYICQQKFGKCPKYIKRRLDQVKAQEKARNEEEIKKQPKCRYIAPEEREKLLGVKIWKKKLFSETLNFISFLKGLKQNWEDLQKHYQALPLMIDTIPKMVRKTKMENTLKDLEKDILMIENNPNIFVYED